MKLRAIRDHVWRAAIIAAVLVSLPSGSFGQGPTAISVIRSQHVRLDVAPDIQGFAVGDSEIVSVEPINNRELLLLGKSSGRTSLLLWFRDGTIKDYLVTVRRDLSML